MRTLALLATAAVLGMSVSACETVAGKTNMLTDDKLIAKSAQSIGVTPSSLQLVSRETDGTNTSAILKTNSGVEYHCLINGGNLLSFGMTNPAQCAKKGEPLSAGPFSH